MEHGEIISLGRHRLMCGDATDKNDVEKLIAGEKVDMLLTDPPYGDKHVQHKNGCIGGGGSGVRANGIYETQNYPMILNNDSTEAARKNYDIVKDLTERKIIWGGHYYADFLPVSRGWIFWDKKVSGYFGDGELAWTSYDRPIKMYSFMWAGMCRDGSLLLNPKPRVHPTQKPVELHMHILEDYGKENDVVLDCFGGSGTTLIACELTGRKCLMMELSPEYCEIIKERYEKVTKQLSIYNGVN